MSIKTEVVSTRVNPSLYVRGQIDCVLEIEAIKPKCYPSGSHEKLKAYMMDMSANEYRDNGEKYLWALEHGSYNLQRALARGHAATRVYETERCAKEFHGLCHVTDNPQRDRNLPYVDTVKGDYRTRNCPSEKALDLAEAYESLPGVESVEIKYAVDDGENTPGPVGCEAVIIYVTWSNNPIRVNTTEPQPIYRR